MGKASKRKRSVSPSEAPSPGYSPSPPPPEENGSDSEEETWTMPNYKDLEWLQDESKRCQKCDKNYENLSGTLRCIASHKKLRCYFCFRIYSNTELLFRHFKNRHKHQENNLLVCPFCEQTVPYQSVSCHVISAHLKTEDSITEEPSTGVPNEGKTEVTICKVIDDNKVRGELKKISNFKEIRARILEQRKQRHRGVVLKLSDLDVTVEKKTLLGTRLVFRIRKERGS